MKSLMISEIFRSISGEVAGFPQGSFCGFIRLAGCNLRCEYCDAKETQTHAGAKLMNINTIAGTLDSFGLKKVIITGGEPLLQMGDLIDLVHDLYNSGYQVSIETNGTIRVPASLSIPATIVMDYKLTHGQGPDHHHFIPLKETDFIKFVIGDFRDMLEATTVQWQLFHAGCKAQFAYSPMLPAPTVANAEQIRHDLVGLSTLIKETLVKKGLQAILNIQIHKLIGMA